MSFTGFRWVLMGFTKFYWVLPSFTGFYWVSLGFTGFYWVLPSFTEFYRVFVQYCTEFRLGERGATDDNGNSVASKRCCWCRCCCCCCRWCSCRCCCCCCRSVFFSLFFFFKGKSNSMARRSRSNEQVASLSAVEPKLDSISTRFKTIPSSNNDEHPFPNVFKGFTGFY